MPYFIEQKKILIVPLSSFIRFNKKISGEQFANLFGNSLDDIFSCDEEIQDHEKFCENLLHKILTSKIVADFNLGKKTTQEFIAELLNFLKLPASQSSPLQTAWNSLLEFDKETADTFYELIKLTHQGKSIYFIGDTNELHAKKVLDIFRKFSFNQIYLKFLENLPETIPTEPFTVSQLADSELASNVLTQSHGKVYFCFSYMYNTLIEQPKDILSRLFTAFSFTPGLLMCLKDYLNTLGKTRDDILLVNPYKKSNAITKKLAFDTISKDNFYTDLHKSVDTPVASMFAPLSSEEHSATIESFSLSTQA